MLKQFHEVCRKIIEDQNFRNFLENIFGLVKQLINEIEVWFPLPQQDFPFPLDRLVLDPYEVFPEGSKLD